MLDKEWCYRGRPDCAGYAVAELNELHYETPGDTRRTWEKDLHRRLYAIPHAWRPGYHKRPHPAVKLPVEDEERNPTEMVAVQVADNDPADPGGVYARTLHRNQRRGTAIDENRIGHPREQGSMSETVRRFRTHLPNQETEAVWGPSVYLRD